MMTKFGKHASETLGGIKVSKFKNVSNLEGGKAMTKMDAGQFYRYV